MMNPRNTAALGDLLFAWTEKQQVPRAAWLWFRSIDRDIAAARGMTVLQGLHLSAEPKCREAVKHPYQHNNQCSSPFFARRLRIRFCALLRLPRLFHSTPQEGPLFNRKPTKTPRISLARIYEKSKFPNTRA